MVKTILFILFFLSPLFYFGQKINNVSVLQEGNNIIITYGLETSQPCTINLFFSNNGGLTWKGPLKEVTGHVGPGIKSGQNSITFYVLKEFDELIGDNIQFKVEAENALKINISKNIYIPNYKTRGPLNAFYSAILPGWGTRRVTFKEVNGWNRFWLVAAPIALSVGAKLISDNNYNKYMNVTDQSEIDKYYNTANNFNKGSIIFAGIAASFYFYDIVWVFGKGCKNVLNSKNKK
jgi:hypothetical protein